MFLSCRPFVAIITLLTSLVGVKVTSVSWLGQDIMRISVKRILCISEKRICVFLLRGYSVFFRERM
jgi:hypothetical protein